jgi:hypothetical protein
LAGLAIDFFPDGRWFALETSRPQTPPTATQALGAETFRSDPGMDPEKLANSWGVGG